MDASERTAPGVKSATRTVELLDFFARQGGMYSLTEIQQELGYPKSSLYALLRTLVQLGWVETDPTGTLYRIGMRALLVGASYIDGDPVVGMAHETLDWLAEVTGETVHFGRLDDHDVVYLSSRPSRHNLRPVIRVGRRVPTHSTSLGKALLADHPDPALPETLERQTERTITDRDALRAELRRIRERGHAVDREENTVGVCCFGVVLRLQRPARDAISVSIPAIRLNETREREISALLLQARERIEYAAYHLIHP
ncbi:IclR family transcriptional regulator [Actinoallomurus rhizosphaericola]|uniref:IclR family transcriptional regulator n=1 Tax=Actinoallomurus rhizosphaericola TaxID=2952536 RepID=UPI00209109FE|nr:IclR family transcriptional regulator [Actinoallomurus rhizosphaericola]MCO5994416.1 IclR family transcriptional regulator [Actinoallomurus rhizosphaericola]